MSQEYCKWCKTTHNDSGIDICKTDYYEKIIKELREACKWALFHLKNMGFKQGEGDIMDTLERLSKDK